MQLLFSSHMPTRYLSVVMVTLLFAACSSVDMQTPTPNEQSDGNQEQAMQQESDNVPAADKQDVQHAIIGTWLSNEDSSLTVQYGADGTVSVVSAAQGGMAFSGTWTVVDPAKEDIGVAADTVAGTTVLRLNYPNASTVYVGIKNVTATTLQTVELASNGGKVATFTKMQ